MERKIKIAYIGGGSKLWARTFMSDLAVAENLSGEIALYDIDMKAAEHNAKIGGYINQDPRTKSKFEYKLCERLEDSLNGADFVVISILPGTFKEMRSDVHAPEKYGIYQPVGDTVGDAPSRIFTAISVRHANAAALPMLMPSMPEEAVSFRRRRHKGGPQLLQSQARRRTSNFLLPPNFKIASLAPNHMLPISSKLLKLCLRL